MNPVRAVMLAGLVAASGLIALLVLTAVLLRLEPQLAKSAPIDLPEPVVGLIDLLAPAPSETHEPPVVTPAPPSAPVAPRTPTPAPTALATRPTPTPAQAATPTPTVSAAAAIPAAQVRTPTPAPTATATGTPHPTETPSPKPARTPEPTRDRSGSNQGPS